MSDIRSMWGKGNAYFYEIGNESNYILIPDSLCQLSFKIEEDEYKNLDEEINDYLDGHRAFLKMRSIDALNETGYQDYLHLLAILETRNFGIKPFYNNTDADILNLGDNYALKETSGFSFIQLHKWLERGQKLDLEFKAKKLVDPRPVNMGMFVWYGDDEEVDIGV